MAAIRAYGDLHLLKRGKAGIRHGSAERKCSLPRACLFVETVEEERSSRIPSPTLLRLASDTSAEPPPQPAHISGFRNLRAATTLLDQRIATFRRIPMNGIIYLVGLVVVVLFILSLLGFR
jgi:hypothetical protein